MPNSSTSFDGTLSSRVIRPSKPQRVRGFRIPGLGRLLFTRDEGEGSMLSSEYLSTNLTAFHRDGDGILKHVHDLGSGTVTNVGVMALANDFGWATGNSTLRLANWHATGTGVTASAATDIALQTLAAPTTTSAVSGVQSLVSTANNQVYKTVATVNYTSTLAITEWGLHTQQTLSATTGSPATATSATSLTATGTPYTASTSSIAGEQQLIVKTGTTSVYGLSLSNTTSAITIPAWYTVSAGTAGSTPGSTETFTLLPVLWDHKVFSAINVVSGDAIQFSYSLTINSGG